MGFFTNFFDRAETCRDAMRKSYAKHFKHAIQNRMEPHTFGLYGALSTRYKVTGIRVTEDMLITELAPFFAMNAETAIEALAEYVVLREMKVEAREQWLTSQINDALRTTPDKGFQCTALNAYHENVLWSYMLDPTTLNALTLWDEDQTNRPTPEKKNWSYDIKTQTLRNNLTGMEYPPNHYERHGDGASGYYMTHGTNDWVNASDIYYM